MNEQDIEQLSRRIAEQLRPVAQQGTPEVPTASAMAERVASKVNDFIARQSASVMQPRLRAQPSASAVAERIADRMRGSQPRPFDVDAFASQVADRVAARAGSAPTFERAASPETATFQGNVASPTLPDRVASSIIDRLRNRMEGVDPEEIQAGDLKEAASLIAERIRKRKGDEFPTHEEEADDD